MGTRLAQVRAADREAAARSGWSVVGPRDVLPVAWTRAWTATPHRWPRAMHALLAAFCAPGFVLDLAATGATGWFHRDDRSVVVRLCERRTVRTAVRVATTVAIVLVYRLVSDLAGRERVLASVAVLGVYGTLVAVLMHLRRRELTTREERQGYLRLPALVEAEWTFTSATPAGRLRGSAAAVTALVDARAPTGARVGAGSRTAAADRELEAVGFATGGQPGHLVRVVPAADPRERPSGLSPGNRP